MIQSGHVSYHHRFFSVDDAAKSATWNRWSAPGTTPTTSGPENGRVILLAQEGVSNHSIAKTTRPVRARR